MTPLELTQMKASGGINKLAAEHIEYQDRVAKVAAQCMKEMQERIDRDQKFIDKIKVEMIEINAGLERLSNET